MARVFLALAILAAAWPAHAQQMTLQIHPQPENEYQTLVTIPYSRIHHHRQYAAPNQDGFTVTVQPA